MNINLQDSIAAVASANGPADRCIIRITGAQTLHFVSLLLPNPEDRDLVTGLQAARRLKSNLQLPALHSQLPVALMLWPTGKSYTGQPMAEIHMIGSAPLVDSVLARLLELGVRAANRGEFTLRAFLTGRIDLVQAEAVLGVIDAADHEELQTALTQLGGAVTESLAAVRDTILQLLGDLEAGLDFVEEDIEFVSSADLSSRLQHCLKRLSELDSQSEQRLPSGRRHRVVLAGLPNAGKSTLFNLLVGESKAIVSDVAGTTRDYLSATVAAHSGDFELVDTAGWESTDDSIMQMAQEIREATISECDLVVWCEAADLSNYHLQLNEQLMAGIQDQGKSIPCLVLVTRSDLDPSRSHSDRLSVSIAPADFEEDAAAAVERRRSENSATAEKVVAAIARKLASGQSSRSELVGTTAVRCRDSLRRTIERLQSAKSAAECGAGDEIVSLELRDALHQLSTILGEVYTDDILDHIFSNFCIGK